MPIPGLPSHGFNGSGAANHGAQNTQGAQHGAAGHNAQSSPSDDRDVAVGNAEGSSSLKQGKAQSQSAVGQTMAGGSAPSAPSSEIQKRIATAEAAVMALLNRTGSEELIARASENYIAMELNAVSGLDRLVALEAMAFSQLSQLLNTELVPLSQTVEYAALPNGELSFVLDGLATQDQEYYWEDRYYALDEAILRLVGTTGSAQTFNHGKRVASLERIVAKVADKVAAKGGGLTLSASNDVVGGYRKDGHAFRAKALAQILAMHGDIENAQGSWLARAAKLEEILFESIGFAPMTRNIVIAEVAE